MEWRWYSTAARVVCSQAPRCKLLVMNRNFADGLLDQRDHEAVGFVIAA
jgi:hypothetical protein